MNAEACEPRERALHRFNVVAADRAVGATRGPEHRAVPRLEKEPVTIDAAFVGDPAQRKEVVVVERRGEPAHLVPMHLHVASHAARVADRAPPNTVAFVRDHSRFGPHVVRLDGAGGELEEVERERDGGRQIPLRHEQGSRVLDADEPFVPRAPAAAGRD